MALPRIRRALATSVLLLGGALCLDAQQASPSAPATTTEFFDVTKVWDVTLAFTAQEWQRLQPRGGGGGMGGFGGGFLGPEGGRNGVAGRAGIEFTYVHAGLDINDRHFTDVAVRYKGNGSYMQGSRENKISLKIDLNEFVKGQKLAGLTTINLQNNITDIGWMNEVLAYRLYRDAGVPGPRSSYARVYFTIEGQTAKQYRGLYSISENIDSNFMQERYGTKAGAILKPSTRSVFTRMGATWPVYNQTYDPKTSLTEAQKARIIEFCTLVSSGTDAEFASRVADFVDLDEFARYFAVLVWLANTDSLLQNGQNYYVYLHPTTNKFMFLPWDQDFSFGNNRRWANDAATIYLPWSDSNLFLGRVYAQDAFKQTYLKYMEEFSRTLFLPDRFAAQMAEIVPVIRPAVQQEGTQWLPAFDQIANGQAGVLVFARARAASVLRQLQAGR